MRRMESARPGLRKLRRAFALLAIGMLTLSMAAATVHADSYDERRVRMGARLFRGMLAADLGLEKHRDAQGRLPLLLYSDEPQLAREISALIAPAESDKAKLRGMPLLLTAGTAAPAEGTAGIFLATRPSDAELDGLIRWSIAHGVILYSPFEGHVERGAAGGLALEQKVRLYINAGTLQAAGVELKPLVLKVAKVHR
jgi:hypothetical protein